MRKYFVILIAAAMLMSFSLVSAQDATPAVTPSPVTAVPGQTVNMLFMPKFTGNPVFDQAYQGALQAQAELQNTGKLENLAPTADNAAGQIDIVTTAASQSDIGALMVDNNVGDQLAPALATAKQAGKTVISWDSPIPSGQNEDLFIAQVDFSQAGQVMADMALDILPDGGQFAVLSASPDAANQNAWIASLQDTLKQDKYSKLDLVDIVYGNDENEKSYNEAQALMDKYPDLKLIMAPTTVGIAAAAKAVQDAGMCDTLKVSGLGLPSDMVAFTMNGCAPEFALWSFVDLGYTTYYTAYMLATGQIKAEAGVQYVAGRMGVETIEKDPTRPTGLRVVMGPFSVYNKDNVQAAANPGGAATPEATAASGG